MNLIASPFIVRLLMLVCIALVGCDTSPTTGPTTAIDHRPAEPKTHTDHRRGDPALPVVSGGELDSLIRHSKLPVLVEFGVDFGCVRCDQMKTEMAHLAQQYEGQATVVRVDFNANRQTAVRYGATICPSYVVFDRSHAVRTRSFPTSADLLSTDLESVMKKEDKQF
jgi:thiol-disulfide isomerase/thioredoxin